MPKKIPLLAVACTVGLVGCDDASSGPISDSGRGAYEASLAKLDDGFVVSWYDTRDGNPEIYARVLDADGRPRGPEWRLTSGPHQSYAPDIETVGDNVAVAWYEVTGTGSLIRLGLWADDGVPIWEQTLSATGGYARSPVLVVDGRSLFCAWLERDGQEWAVWAGRIDLEGHLLAAPVRIGSAGETTWNLNAALDRDGIPWVVFDAATDDGTEELFAARVADDAAQLVQLTVQDGVASRYPDVAFGAARVSVTWFDERDGNREVYLAVVRYEQMLEGVDEHSRRITRTLGESIGAYVSWNGRQLGLAWCDDTEGNYEIYFQRFTADGDPLDQPQRMTTNTTASLIPAIEPFRQGFALAWNEDVVEERGSHGHGGRSEVAFAVVP